MRQRIHRLKTVQPFFDGVSTGDKTFEVRLDDRSFEVGDFLLLEEFIGGQYTGFFELRQVTYILRHDDYPAIQEGYAVLGIINPLAQLHGHSDVLKSLDELKSALETWAKAKPEIGRTDASESLMVKKEDFPEDPHA